VGPPFGRGFELGLTTVGGRGGEERLDFKGEGRGGRGRVAAAQHKGGTGEDDSPDA